MDIKTVKSKITFKIPDGKELFSFNSHNLLFAELKIGFL